MKTNAQAALADFLRQWHSDCDFIVARTSGSTGAPKEIRMPKADMVASARATNKRFGITSSSTLFLPLSMDYIAGKMMAVRAIVADCKLVAVEPSNRFCFPCSSTDLVAVVPSQVDWLVEHPEWAQRMDSVIVGGAAVSAARRQALVDAGYRAFSTYGMTETCSHVALAAIEPEEQPYRAMPGISFDTDSRGCLRINAPGFSFGSLLTNDVVELIDDKSFRWRGRIDNVINSGGIKIFPEELEKQYASLISSTFYIHGIPDDKWGQAIELMIETTASAETIMATLRPCIDPKFLPKSIKTVSSIPRTPTGKILRSPLPQSNKDD